MNVEHLNEFVVFTQRMSYAKAASELFLTQSSLSKHIRQLETELGFPLVYKSRNKVITTPAGGCFFNGLVPLLERFNELRQECQTIHENSQSSLTILEPPYSDVAGAEMFMLLDGFKSRHPHVGFKFARLHGSSTLEALAGGKIDLLLEYRCGDVKGLRAEYHAKGFFVAHLLKTPVKLWCDSGHPLAGFDSIKAKQLKSVPIMTSSDIYSPMRKATLEMCEASGFKPILHYESSPLKVEFLFASPPESVYVLPAGLEQDTRMLSRRSMVFRDIDDMFFESFLVLSNLYEQNASMQKFYEYMKTIESSDS